MVAVPNDEVTSKLPRGKFKPSIFFSWVFSVITSRVRLIELITSSKKNKDIKKIVAVIGSIDSIGSIKVHKKLGFKNCGKLKKIGFKKNRWIDCIIMQKDL